MADSVSADDVLPTIEEISNMKVADLRKKLKALGLPIMGNKTELIERLHEACMTTKDSFESSGLSFDESQIELENTDCGVAEESVLLEQEHFSSYADSSLDESKVLVSSENKLNLSTNSPSITKPLKKRTITAPANTANAAIDKKLVINRTNVTHTDLSMKPDSVSKPEPVVSSNKSEISDKRVLSIKNLSSAERMALRAKRFNVNNTVETTVSTPKSTTLNLKNSNKSIVSAPVTPDLDKLKKRAERFGQKVSTVLKQLEQKERLMKRKCKFGVSVTASATSSLDEIAKKKQRAERFGM